MDIVKLTKIEGNPSHYFGHNGYVTEQIYQVSSQHKEGIMQFELTAVDKPYTKNWITGDDDIQKYNNLINQGHSFGAFDGDKICGWIICEYREWNNTLYIENILVAQTYRGTGVGRKLIATSIAHAVQLNCRLVELETQNTNLPAIGFYRKLGFEVSGLHTKLYAGEDSHGTAIYMTYDLMLAH